MQRIAEPEIMDIPERAAAYAAGNFREVNDAFVNRLLELAGDAPSQRVLDVGTGPGDIALMAGQRRADWQVAGLDASFPMLAIAQAQARNLAGDIDVGFVLTDAKASAFRDNSFDIVYSNSILHHIAEPSALWREIGRVAKAGALLFLRDLARPGSREEAEAIVEAYASEESAILKEDFYNSLLASYTVEEVNAQLEESNLAGLEVQMVTDRHLDVVGRIAS